MFYKNDEFLKQLLTFVNSKQLKNLNEDEHFNFLTNLKIDDVFAKNSKKQKKQISSEQEYLFAFIKEFLLNDKYSQLYNNIKECFDEKHKAFLSFNVVETEEENLQNEQIIEVYYNIQKAFFNDELSKEYLQENNLNINQKELIMLINLTSKKLELIEVDWEQYQQKSLNIFKSNMSKNKALEIENASISLKLENYKEWYRITQQPKTVKERIEYMKTLKFLSSLSTEKINELIKREELEETFTKNKEIIEENQTRTQQITRILPNVIKKDFLSAFENLKGVYKA